MTVPEIQEVGELKGKVGAVNRIETTSDVGLRLALRRLGLDPEKDIKLIALGDDTARLAGMKGGQVQFTILAEPWIREAERLGFMSLLPIAKLGIPFHWNATVTRESVIKTKREALRRFVRAMTEAIALIKQDREESMRIIAKYLKVEDHEALQRALGGIQRRLPGRPASDPRGRGHGARRGSQEAARGGPISYSGRIAKYGLLRF